MAQEYFITSMEHLFQALYGVDVWASANRLRLCPIRVLGQARGPLKLSAF